MERKSYKVLNEFLGDYGYKNQTEFVKKLVKEGVYEKLPSALSIFNQIINGKRPPTQKLLHGLEKLSVDSKEFMIIIETYRERYLKKIGKNGSFEREVDNLYQTFKDSILKTDDLCKKTDLLMDFRKFVKKHSK